MKLLSNVSVALTVLGCVLFLECTYNGYSPYELHLADHGDSCNCSTDMLPLTAKALMENQMNEAKRLKPTVRIQSPVQTTRKLGPTFLLIMVPILFSSVESRDLIRGSWYKGFRDSEDVMLRYIMGVNGLNDSQINKLHEENKTHGDLVFLDNFTEGIWALTNKTIALMTWATENVDFTYLMKCDDDTFLYVHNTIRELKRRATTKRLYYGMIMYKHKPIHNNQSKWKDFKWGLSKTYTPFARGGCYMLSEDLVHLIVRQRHRLRWHHLEDVAVGLWLAPFDYERRDDGLICFINHPDVCSRDDYRVARLISVKSDKLAKEKFNILWKEMLNAHANITYTT